MVETLSGLACAYAGQDMLDAGWRRLKSMRKSSGGGCALRPFFPGAENTKGMIDGCEVIRGAIGRVQQCKCGQGSILVVRPDGFLIHRFPSGSMACTRAFANLRAVEHRKSGTMVSGRKRHSPLFLQAKGGREVVTRGRRRHRSERCLRCSIPFCSESSAVFRCKVGDKFLEPRYLGQRCQCSGGAADCVGCGIAILSDAIEACYILVRIRLATKVWGRKSGKRAKCLERGMPVASAFCAACDEGRRKKASVK